MALNRRYGVTLPGPVAGHAPPQVVLMVLSDDVGPGGSHIWTDSAGGWRMQIEGEVAIVLSAPAGYDGQFCLHAVPLP